MANAQSGASSAVGFCVETVFRSVPLTPGAGNLNSVGIAASNPLRFFIAEPGGGFDVKPTKDIASDEQDGDFSIHRITMTAKNYPGKESFKIDPENLYYPALGVFGRDVETTVAAGAYDHVFTPATYLPSFTQEEQYGDGSSGRLSSGVIIHALHISHNAILTASIDTYAHRQIPNRYAAQALSEVDYDFTNVAGLLPSQLGGNHTKQVKLTVAPSYVDVAEGNCGNGPLVFANAVTGNAVGFSNAFLTLNDVAIPIKILPGWTIDIVKDVESHMTAGSGYDPSDPVGNVISVSGKMDVLFADNTIPGNTLANCKFGVNMLFRGAQIGATGFYYEYEIYIPRMKFLDNPSPRSGSKTVVTGGSFQAEKDAVLGYEVRMRLRNSFTHAALAGGNPQLGNGMGGWVSV